MRLQGHVSRSCNEEFRKALYKRDLSSGDSERNVEQEQHVRVSGCELPEGPGGGKYRAYIKYQRKDIFLGNFDRIEDAIEARLIAEKEYFGEVLGSEKDSCD